VSAPSGSLGVFEDEMKEIKRPHIWLGSFIRERRIANSFQQSELASMLGFKCPRALSEVENGKVPLPVRRIRDFCEVTKTEPEVYIHRATENYRENLIRKIGESK
jgi:transcriptional regulator with XRE-family HTH domain